MILVVWSINTYRQAQIARDKRVGACTAGMCLGILIEYMILWPVVNMNPEG